LRIAICDDESTTRTKLRKTIESSCLLPHETSVIEFSNGKSLIEGHINCPHDIVFLDIQMPEISGLEAGQKIRLIDKNAIIIFLTGFDQFIFQSLKLEIFDYLIKPASEASIAEVLCRAIKKHEDAHHLISVKCNGALHALDISKIVYIRGYYRRVMFFTESDLYECNDSLDIYERKLQDKGFLRCHRNVLINMYYIKSIEISSITTVNNQTLEMSVRKKQACLRRYNEFLIKYRV